MNVIYNSDNYYVVEYPAQHGYELVDKQAQRGTYFQGDVADKFARSMRNAVAVPRELRPPDDPVRAVSLARMLHSARCGFSGGVTTNWRRSMRADCLFSRVS